MQPPTTLLIIILATILISSSVVQTNLCWYLNKAETIRVPLVAVFAYENQLLLIDYLNYYQITDEHIHEPPYSSTLDFGSTGSTMEKSLTAPLLVDLREARNGTLTSRWTMFDSNELEAHGQSIVVQKEPFFCFHNNQPEQKLDGKCFSLKDDRKVIAYNRDMTKSIVDRPFWDQYRKLWKCRIKSSITKTTFQMVLVANQNETKNASLDCQIEWRVNADNDPEPQTFQYRKQIYIFNTVYGYSFERPGILVGSTVIVRQQLLKSILVCDPNMTQKEKDDKMTALQYIMLAVGVLFVLVLVFEVLYIVGFLRFCAGLKKTGLTNKRVNKRGAVLPRRSPVAPNTRNKQPPPLVNKSQQPPFPIQNQKSENSSAVLSNIPDDNPASSETSSGLVSQTDPASSQMSADFPQQQPLPDQQFQSEISAPNNYCDPNNNNPTNELSAVGYFDNNRSSLINDDPGKLIPIAGFMNPNTTTNQQPYQPLYQQYQPPSQYGSDLDRYQSQISSAASAPSVVQPIQTQVFDEPKGNFYNQPYTTAGPSGHPFLAGYPNKLFNGPQQRGGAQHGQQQPQSPYMTKQQYGRPIEELGGGTLGPNSSNHYFYNNNHQ